MSDHPSGNGFKRDARVSYQNYDGSARGKDEQWQMMVKANRRNVWNDIRPEPYLSSHYATFPPDLSRLCIQASTSERGCCPVCGNQITRVIDKPKVGAWHDNEEKLTQGRRQNGAGPANEYETAKTTGWRPTCDHDQAAWLPGPWCRCP